MHCLYLFILEIIILCYLFAILIILFKGTFNIFFNNFINYKENICLKKIKIN